MSSSDFASERGRGSDLDPSRPTKPAEYPKKSYSSSESNPLPDADQIAQLQRGQGIAVARKVVRSKKSSSSAFKKWNDVHGVSRDTSLSTLIRVWCHELHVTVANIGGKVFGPSYHRVDLQDIFGGINCATSPTWWALSNVLSILFWWVIENSSCRKGWGRQFDGEISESECPWKMVTFCLQDGKLARSKVIPLFAAVGVSQRRELDNEGSRSWLCIATTCFLDICCFIETWCDYNVSH